MNRRHVLLWLGVLCVGATPRPSAAQIRAPSLAEWNQPSRGVASRRTDSAITRTPPPVRRAPLAAPGWLVGAAVGGTIGYAVIPHDPVGEDPGLEQFMWGVTVGGVLGSAAPAALPGRGSDCTFTTRLTRSLLVGSAGAAAGLALVQMSDSPVVAFSLPLLTIAGATFGSGAC